VDMPVIKEYDILLQRRHPLVVPFTREVHIKRDKHVAKPNSSWALDINYLVLSSTHRYSNSIALAPLGICLLKNRL
jgi:hypothetical protein